MIECMPQEIEVRYIIPAIRREFARILVLEKKISQKETAKFLDLTEAAVSQYLNSKRARDIEFSGNVILEIRNSIDKLNSNHNKHGLIKELYRICNLKDVKQIMCEIHRSLSKDLDECNVCFDSNEPVDINI